MKISNLSIASIFILISLLLTSCESPEEKKRKLHEQSIKRVVNEACAVQDWYAEISKKVEDETLFGKEGVGPEYIRKLYRIDTAGCPEDFVTAFQRYLRAENEIIESVEGLQGVGGFLTNMITLGQDSMIPAALKRNERHKERRQALLEIEASLNRHGIWFE